MRTFVALALALCCSGQVTVPLVKVPFPWAIKYQGFDGFGQTTFGHQAIDQTRHEVRLADGRVLGQFSYIDANGKPAVTYFEAGPNGYRVLGSNNLPEAPEVDFENSVPEYTEDVARARAEFMEIYEAARKGNIILPVADPMSSVPEFTEDVARARAEFMEIFEEARKGNIISPAVPSPVPVIPESEPTLTVETSEDEEEPTPPEEPVEVKEPTLAVADENVADHAAEEDAVDAPAPERRRRDAPANVPAIPLPYLHAVPTETKTTFETKQFEPVDAATPADTKKIELTTKEHVFKVPGFKFVQPLVQVKPVDYSLLTPQLPQVVPYSQVFYPGFGHQFVPVVAAAPKEE